MGQEQQGRLFDEAAGPAPAPAPRSGERRLRRPQRDQIDWRCCPLDDLLPPDHQARVVWQFVEALDIAPLLAEIQAVEDGPGQAPADPRLYLALWLYATLRGIGSAREVNRLCREHVAYQWLCGGVSVNYHGLADFRVAHEAYLDETLTASVAVLLHQGLATLERTAVDGMRTRADAGAASFRRAPTLQQAREEAAEQVAALKIEAAHDGGAGTRRRRAAAERAARERLERLDAALSEMPEVTARKQRAKRKRGESAEDYDKRTAPRVSTTDPEARVMKMPDGGFRPGANVVVASDTASRVIVAVAVTNVGSDHGQMVPLTKQIERRYGRRPTELLADNGFDKREDIDELAAGGTSVFMPVQKQRGVAEYSRRAEESEAVGDWRERMGTAEAKEIYKERASTAECVNAHLRRQGLRQFGVRGLAKLRQVVLWHAIAHNLRRAVALGARF